MMDFNPIAYSPDGTAIFARDDQLLVKFFRHPELSQVKSVREGMPVYDDVDMIEVITPGEREPVKVIATEFHKRRFPKQWQAYQAGVEQSASGTPIELLFVNQPSLVLHLKSRNIHTIQHLAGLSDTVKQSVGMGAEKWQLQARDYLAKAGEGQPFHQMQAMQDEIEKLKAQLAERGEAPSEPQPEARRGPGRPRNNPAAA